MSKTWNQKAKSISYELVPGWEVRYHSGETRQPGTNSWLGMKAAIRLGRLIFCLTGLLVGPMRSAGFAIADNKRESSILKQPQATDKASIKAVAPKITRIKICAVINPGATKSQIASLVAACPIGQVVKLNKRVGSSEKAIYIYGTKSGRRGALIQNSRES